jgi:hypothetical protein
MGLAMGTVTAPDGSIVSAQLANANLEMPNTLDMNGKELILDADGDTSIEASTDDTIVIDTAGSERMRIDASGNVGIGHTAPDVALDVMGAFHLRSANLAHGSTTIADTNEYANFIEENTGNGGLRINAISEATSSNLSAFQVQAIQKTEDTGYNNAAIRLRCTKIDGTGETNMSNSAAMLTIGNGGTEVFRVIGQGDVTFSKTSWDRSFDNSDTNVCGVNISPGDTSGSQQFQIDAASYGAEIIIINNIQSSGFASVLQYRTQNSAEGSLRGNVNGLSISNNSDYRKKERITDLTGSIDVIKTLKPRQYYYRKGFGKETRAFAGFIAHEVQDSALPHMTTGVKDAHVTEKDKTNEEYRDMKVGDPIYQTVAYTDNELITRLVGAVQELSAKVETLEAELAKLKG